jgi:hypothetical protein
MNSSNDKKSPKEKSDGVSQHIKAHIKACFTLGLGANFEHFWLVVWPQGFANWPPKFDGIFSSSLGAK